MLIKEFTNSNKKIIYYKILISMLIKISKKETLSEKDLQDIEKLYDEILTFSNERDFINNLDLEFLKKQIQKY